MTEQEQEKEQHDCKIATNFMSTILMLGIVLSIFILFGYFFIAVLAQNKIGLFGIITLSGAIGGIVTSLDSKEGHAFSIPFSGNELHSGFIGHCFIGICGAFVGIGATLLLTPFDLSIFWQKNIEVSALLKPLIITISLGIIGGFSGLPIISKLSNHAIKKLESTMNEHKEKINVQDKKINNQDRKIQEETERNIKQEIEIEKTKKGVNETKMELKNTQDQLKKAKDNLEYNKAMIHINNKDFDLALSCFNNIANSKHYINDEKYWINKAFTEKRCLNIPEALKSIEKTLKINPKNIYGLYNKMCYLSLLSQDDSEMISLYEQIKKLDTDPNFNEIMDQIIIDEDLSNLRKSSSYEKVDIK
ncbi:hypothetical protein C0W54_21190 [Photobacterium kishitanii]|uniref:hypothetical protein n=1 Tax=Photobacterium kishitanii TaxID=318456 RepID=UPI000D162612|nr:hypothetical protein [Photobacterium kishitanii]PSW58779.1 hypothetical protein C0W54_21190 [Photobacterium kishitanii]